jgi:polyhydroxybutyrate depolymerase
MGGRYNATADIDDAGFLLKIIAWAIEHRNVDPQRIYITGHSSGGNMAQRMIIEYPNTFAAAASFVSTLPDRYIPFPSHGTPIALFCGTMDNRVPYDGGYRNGRGELLSAEATRDYFVAMNNAGPMIETTLPDVDRNDNCTIVSQYFPHNTTPVLYYKLDGGSHNFVGKTTFAGFPIPQFVIQRFERTLGNICNDADGATLAWNFMSQFTLPS